MKFWVNIRIREYLPTYLGTYKKNRIREIKGIVPPKIAKLFLFF